MSRLTSTQEALADAIANDAHRRAMWLLDYSDCCRLEGMRYLDEKRIGEARDAVRRAYQYNFRAVVLLRQAEAAIRRELG